MSTTENLNKPIKSPRVFISYAWGNLENQDRVRELADLLIKNGVSVLLDQYDLKPGDNQYEFMQRSVLEANFVLVLCDENYKIKANDFSGKCSGVKTETLILTPQVLGGKDSSHIIPIFWEPTKSENEPFYAPSFLEAKYGFDFTTRNKANRNLMFLLRRLFECPEYEKPKLGSPPSFVFKSSQGTQNTRINRLSLSLQSLKLSLEQGLYTVGVSRDEFLEQCHLEIAALQTTTAMDEWNKYKDEIGNRYAELSQIRSLICEWLWFEGKGGTLTNLHRLLHNFLESLLCLRGTTSNWITQYNTVAHKCFLYDLFVHVIATLIKLQLQSVVRYLLESPYVSMETSAPQHFDAFWVPQDDAIHSLSDPPQGGVWRAPLRRIIERTITSPYLTIEDLIAADVVIACKCCLLPWEDKYSHPYWYPHLIGNSHHDICARVGGLDNLILKAQFKTDFKQFGDIFSINSGSSFRKLWEEATTAWNQSTWKDVLQILSFIIHPELLDTRR